MIKEDFLHYLWHYKLFDFSNLRGTNKEKIQLINLGKLNTNSGPDFFNAQIKIKEQIWAGNVEIHIKSSDWYVYNHEKDIAYDNVILHVVWEYDMPVFRSDNSEITTLVLKEYIATDLWQKHQNLFTQGQKWIFCEKDINTINPFDFSNWKERLYIERLEEKTTNILELLSNSNNDWEAVLFKMLAKNFGLKVNGAAFMQMANSIDFSLVRKNQHSLQKMEALFFGQSGMLALESEAVYYQILQKEYAFLQVKHKILPIHEKEVKFFRLRPSNFPTIRLSQLASLYITHQNLFSKLIHLTSLDAYYELLNTGTSEFWKNHYTFTSTSKKRTKKLTKSFIDLLLINTIIPLQFVYQKKAGKLKVENTLSLIRQIKSEKNSIITSFSNLKITAQNALESQALLQLKNRYCDKQKCLQCVIGQKLLTTNSAG